MYYSKSFRIAAKNRREFSSGTSWVVIFLVDFPKSGGAGGFAAGACEVHVY